MIILAIVLAVVGLGAGFGVNETINRKRNGATADQSKKELEKAKKDATKITEEAREEAGKIIDEARREEQNRRKEFKDLEIRLVQREESLDKKLDDIDKRSERLRGSESEVETLKDEIRDIRKKQQDKLEKIAKLTKADAADKLMQMTERDIREDLTELISKLQNEAKEEAEDQAALIITSAMERMASEVTAERTITSVKLEDEEMKGRIIGKEGRNIQALQRATGVDILVDDTPG
jgi:ribonuclease Y